MSSLNSSVTMVDRFQRIYSHSSRFVTLAVLHGEKRIDGIQSNLDKLMDEKPEMVNPLIESVVARHSKSSTAFAPGI
ncbi:hypothetical protein HID58_014517 [Brassica napus]|uniref:Uncharacterized protein n=1 Tax=Brassica napus TaxID=3708 RepID=A0ABQ8DHC9_BRANA|nr:hypothetical protein HID58_014517 [Brassica napus]